MKSAAWQVVFGIAAGAVGSAGIIMLGFWAAYKTGATVRHPQPTAAHAATDVGVEP